MLKNLAGVSLIGLCCVAQAAPSSSPILQSTIVEAAAHQAGAYRYGPLQGGFDHLAHEVQFVQSAAFSGSYLASAGSGRRLGNSFGSGFGAGERTLNWTPGTTLLVSAVPEPTNYSLLAFGMILVAVAARRQRRFLRG
jgi:hypothetical protein